ncbi:MAG: DUF1080 domain-containing protein [Verrucomicrobia bacterium]|nr:DUF1080 domain-containing protein [Verrucomicrobiota bacterium]
MTSIRQDWIWITAITLCAAATAIEPNQLSDAERKAGWKLLFDGETVTGWQGARGLPFPSQSWNVQDHSLQTLSDGEGGDIWTDQRYSNFELELDYRILENGNSGVKYLVQPEWLSPLFQPDLSEAEKHHYALEAVGPEFQIMDDAAMEQKDGWQLSSTGSLYLLYAPKNKHLKPPGEWNHIRIVVNGMHVEHWLNGGKLLEYELGSDELLARVETTKFRKVPGFGRKGPGHIVLQHHDHPAAFRNVKIRELR